MSDNAHTPTPWASNGNRVENRDEHGIVNDGWIICDCDGPDAEVNAEFIVRACNAHADLVEALVMVRDADEDCKRDGLPTIPPIPRAKIDAALSKASGEKT